MALHRAFCRCLAVNVNVTYRLWVSFVETAENLLLFPQKTCGRSFMAGLPWQVFHAEDQRKISGEDQRKIKVTSVAGSVEGFTMALPRTSAPSSVEGSLRFRGRPGRSSSGPAGLPQVPLHCHLCTGVCRKRGVLPEGFTLQTSGRPFQRSAGRLARLGEDLRRPEEDPWQTGT